MIDPFLLLTSICLFPENGSLIENGVSKDKHKFHTKVELAQENVMNFELGPIPVTVRGSGSASGSLYTFEILTRGRLRVRAWRGGVYLGW